MSVSHPCLFIVLLAIATSRTTFLIFPSFLFPFSSCPAWITSASGFPFLSRTTLISPFHTFCLSPHPTQTLIHNTPPRVRARFSQRGILYAQPAVIIHYPKVIYKHIPISERA